MPCLGCPGHLDVRGEVCVPWVWHLQGFFSRRADLRKSPQTYVLSGAGSRGGQPAKIATVQWPQLTHLLSVAAEKVTSLGKDWHRPCLRCEKCNKTLTSGGHAEVRFGARQPRAGVLQGTGWAQPAGHRG